MKSLEKFIRGTASKEKSTIQPGYSKSTKWSLVKAKNSDNPKD
jgi:hypothetical protein